MSTYNAIPAEKDDNFSLMQIDRDLYLCKEKYYTVSWADVANTWVVKGTVLDLVIDTGIGLWDLPGFLKEKQVIGDKPFQAVATHIHFDHSGGLHQFQDFAIHRAEAEAIRTGNSFEACCVMKKCDVSKPPDEDWRARNYKIVPAQPTRILEDGDIFDLGDKKLRVLHLPGHSRGSIALHDEANRNLFTGDIILDDQAIFDFLPYSSVPQTIESFEILLDIAPNVEKVFPGHFHHFNVVRMKEIATRYLNNAGRCHDCGVFCLKSGCTCLLKGRNTKGLSAEKCCFFSCCCCFCW